MPLMRAAASVIRRLRDLAHSTRPAPFPMKGTFMRPELQQWSIHAVRCR